MDQHHSRCIGGVRSMFALAAALVAVWLAATPAAAVTIGIDANRLVIGAEPGDAAPGGPGLVFIGRSTGSLFTLDAIPGVEVAIVTSGCSAGASGVDCDASLFASLLVIGSEGDDVFLFGDSAIGGIFAGVAGNDNLFGSTANDVVYGGPGDDILFGTDGADTFYGGPGDDFVAGIDSGDLDPRFDPLPRPAVPVPEPASMLLMLAGLGILGLSRRAPSPRAAISTARAAAL